MDQISSALKPVFGPLQDLYNKAFNANKYAAGVGLSVVITTFLFFVMVILISLGDSGIKEDTSVKLADIVMPERQIDTFLSEVDKPDKPEEQPEDIAQPELDLQPLTGIDVSIAKPKANFKSSGSFFRDGEYIPLFKVQPVYPRRAQERGTEGYVILAFTITESGTIENPYIIEGKCRSANNRDGDFRECSMFNSAAMRAASKLKYKPTVRDGRAVAVDDVPHKFTFELEDEA